MKNKLCKAFAFFSSLAMTLIPSIVFPQEEEQPIDDLIPYPEVTYSNPKSDLIQLAWLFRGEGSKRIERVDVWATDSELKIFTCENDNYMNGICTISGLSGDTTYNLTVRGCSSIGCGKPGILYVTTSSPTRIDFSTICVIFIALLIFAFVTFNHDLVVEVSRPCWSSVMRRIRRRRTPAPDMSSPKNTVELRELESNNRTTSFPSMENEPHYDDDAEEICEPATPRDRATDNEDLNEQITQLTDCQDSKNIE
ncbi:uncharacterized protein LOC135220781 [Macrobrachium nipponense]|uniref:uncharacterized protein LOC135220781 n=1 Tax=Macrobrachium nipponense TaxID=159736 RepID=UPI0030C7A816